MDKRFLGILAAVVVIFVGIFIVSSGGSDKSSSSGGNSSNVTNHVTGKGQKNVTLMEYGDYQCPICGAYYLPLKEVYAQFQNDIYFQFRNLPLVQIHPNAFAAARAAEAAGMQNKYWEMHDKLYDNQTVWSTSTSPSSFFESYAKQLNLNLDQFKKDYASAKVNDAINADIAEFDKTKQPHATPTFFLDGVHLDNSQVSDANGQPSVEKFTQVINAEIAKKSANKQ